MPACPRLCSARASKQSRGELRKEYGVTHAAFGGPIQVYLALQSSFGKYFRRVWCGDHEGKRSWEPNTRDKIFWVAGYTTPKVRLKASISPVNFRTHVVSEYAFARIVGSKSGATVRTVTVACVLPRLFSVLEVRRGCGTTGL